jgi:hypothetical protein
MKKVDVAFSADDVSPVVAALDPAGWVNLEPDIEDPPPPPGRGWVASIFSNRGPMPTFATWHPGERSAGIQHNTGPKLARRVAVPAGWRVVQDHPRRGLVVRVPEGVADEQVLRWLVDLGEELTQVDTDRKWHAVVHTP